MEGSEGLHARRGLGLRVYANGRVSEPAADIREVLTGRMSRFAELPTVAVDGGGSIWLVFRHWTIRKPHEMFHAYATRLGERGWTTPVLLENSAGRNTQRTPVTRAPDGRLHLAFASDLRSPDNLPRTPTHALHYNVFVASLDKAPGSDPALKEVAVETPRPAFAHRTRSQMAVEGRTYTLLLGDCHRHTDVRGHSAVDGSIEDTYRYALDAARMDFVGPSDHNEVLGGRWPDSLRDYQWWYAQKLADVYTHAPKFWGIYSYEHSMARPGGHRNVLFLKRGAPVRPIDRAKGRRAPDNTPPALWEWMRRNVLTQVGQKTVIVPHTFAAGPIADWNWEPAPFDCLLEIYQGARGSYERWRAPDSEKRGGTQIDDPGHFAQDALAKGHRYGFVSFSDHGSTHNSWAAVWAEEPSRAALFDAMLARRTFAASDEISVKATAGGQMVGAAFAASAASPPEIRVEVEAQDEILRIDIVKDGEYVYTQRPGGRAASLSYKDSGRAPGTRTITCGCSSGIRSSRTETRKSRGLRHSSFTTSSPRGLGCYGRQPAASRNSDLRRVPGPRHGPVGGGNVTGCRCWRERRCRPARAPGQSSWNPGPGARHRGRRLLFPVVGAAEPADHPQHPRGGGVAARLGPLEQVRPNQRPPVRGKQVRGPEELDRHDPAAMGDSDPALFWKGAQSGHLVHLAGPWPVSAPRLVQVFRGIGGRGHAVARQDLVDRRPDSALVTPPRACTSH